jgi:hypothetical protein
VGTSAKTNWDCYKYTPAPTDDTEDSWDTSAPAATETAASCSMVLVEELSASCRQDYYSYVDYYSYEVLSEESVKDQCLRGTNCTAVSPSSWFGHTFYARCGSPACPSESYYYSYCGCASGTSNGCGSDTHLASIQARYAYYYSSSSQAWTPKEVSNAYYYSFWEKVCKDVDHQAAPTTSSTVAVWEKNAKKHCGMNNILLTTYSTLASAKDACTQMAAGECGGVYDEKCDDSGLFYICMSGAWADSSWSCIYTATTSQEATGTSSPTSSPTSAPTVAPTSSPTASPTSAPTAAPTSPPT